MKYCNDYAALLDLYVDGELSPDEMLRVQEHLDTCPGCQAYVDDGLAIRASFPQVDDTVLPDGLHDRILSAVATTPRVKERRKPIWLRSVASLAACCAIVFLGLSSGILNGGSSRSFSTPGKFRVGSI